MWSQDLSGSGSTLTDTVKDQVMETLETDYLLEDHMADYGVTVTDEELEEIQKAAAQFMEDNEQPAIERMTATEENVAEMLRLDTIQQKMHAAIIAKVDTEVSDEDAAQRTFSYYNITIPEDTESEAATEDAGTEAVSQEQTTEEQAEELKAYAEQVAADAANDFDAVADTYGQTVSTYSYGTDEDSFDKTVIAKADEMTEGQISDLIKTDDGKYYVIRLDSEFDQDATDSKKQEIISDRQSDYYTEICDGYKKDADWSVKDKVWANVTFEGNTYTISTNDTESTADGVTEGTESTAVQ